MAFNDQTAYHIARLHPRLAELAYQFINELRTAGVPAHITSSRRTTTEQARLVRAGLSNNPRSKHLTGLAFDFDILGFGRNQIPRQVLDAIGAYGESLGMKWGGRWKSPYDPGHFEI